MRKEVLVDEVLNQVCGSYRTFNQILKAINVLESAFGKRFFTRKSLINLYETEGRRKWFDYLEILPECMYTCDWSCESEDIRTLLNIYAVYESQKINLVIWHGRPDCKGRRYSIFIYHVDDAIRYSPIAEFGKKPEVQSLTLV